VFAGDKRGIILFLIIQLKVPLWLLRGFPRCIVLYHIIVIISNGGDGGRLRVGVTVRLRYIHFLSHLDTLPLYYNMIACCRH